jgi:hypothetical protein
MKVVFNFACLDPVVMNDRKNYTDWNLFIKKDDEYNGYLSAMSRTNVDLNMEMWRKYNLKKLS